MNIKKIFSGPSSDSLSLMFVKFCTIFFSLATTRILSEHFSILEYGTYSQISLIISTTSSITIFGMMDGINFFFHKEQDEIKRNKYISTIFSLQLILSLVVSVIILLCTVPISMYFENEKLKNLIVFAAILPLLQNLISLLQILFIAVGKVKLIAARNLILSFLKLIFVVLACYVFNNIIFILLFSLLLDIFQVLFFYLVLKKDNLLVNFFKIDKTLIKEIFSFCLPMAMFALVSSLNRDCDKYVISAFTNTETLAIYTNASKYLPFDIIMTSFCTVLLPYITSYISKQRFFEVKMLYKSFLEVTYVSTSILIFSALIVAPELMEFLYSKKYIDGLDVFIIYLFVDLFKFLNITLILSSAGKTKTIMYISAGSLIFNLFLNIPLYFMLGIIGPAIGTLIITLISGIITLIFSSKTINCKINELFDFKNIFLFIIKLFFSVTLIYLIKLMLLRFNVNSLFIMLIIVVLSILLLGILNFKRFIINIKNINKYKLNL